MTEPDAKIGGRVAGVGGISFLVGIYLLETRRRARDVEPGVVVNLSKLNPQKILLGNRKYGAYRESGPGRGFSPPLLNELSNHRRPPSDGALAHTHPVDRQLVDIVGGDSQHLSHLRGLE